MKPLENKPVSSDRISTIEELCQAIEQISDVEDLPTDLAAYVSDVVSTDTDEAALVSQVANLWMDITKTEPALPESDPLTEIFLQRRGPSN